MLHAILALTLAAGPAAAQIPWGGDFDALACGQWEALDMQGRIDRLKAIEPFGDDLEHADRGAAEQWEGEVAKVCRGHPDKLLRDAAAEALGPT